MARELDSKTQPPPGTSSTTKKMMMSRRPRNDDDVYSKWMLFFFRRNCANSPLQKRILKLDSPPGVCAHSQNESTLIELDELDENERAHTHSHTHLHSQYYPVLPLPTVGVYRKKKTKAVTLPTLPVWQREATFNLLSPCRPVDVSSGRSLMSRKSAS